MAYTAIDTLKTLGWKSGQAVNVIFDDTQQQQQQQQQQQKKKKKKKKKKKRGKQMDALSKIFLHAEKVYAQGHTILGCAIVYRDTVIPFAVRLWVPKSFAEQTQRADYDGDPLEYRKLTELAAEIIRDLPLQKATVLFDAYYLCPNVTEAWKDRKYRYVGVAKKNRNFFADDRDRDNRKLSPCGANVLRRDGRWQTVRVSDPNLGWVTRRVMVCQ
ncbi:MAG TPA: transposase [Pirellulaceae bacterium]|nr:transposase [Pirellulaceae bacterium]